MVALVHDIQWATSTMHCRHRGARGRFGLVPKQGENPIVRLLAAAVGLLAGVGLTALLPTGETWGRALTTLFPGIIGATIWIMSGSGIVAAMSWVAPVTAILALAEFVIPRPYDVLALSAGLGWYLAMLVWVPFVEWWYERVLRRDPASKPFR